MNTKKNLFLILLMGIFMGACSSKMAKVEATTPQENKEETKEEKVKSSMQQVLTELGSIIDNYDRYMEEVGTLCLLHYMLSTNSKLASSWYYFFNEFNMREFTKEDYMDSILSFLILILFPSLYKVTTTLLILISNFCKFSINRINSSS